MSTNSIIAIKNRNGTVDSAYCHNDGYPSHNGAILAEHYNDESRVRSLISQGDMSVLGKHIDPDPSVEHKFGAAQLDVTIFYGRDRGERNSRPIQYKSLDKALGDSEEFFYLFVPGDGWWVRQEPGDFERLDDRLMAEFI